jgi:hypothetical protein
MDYPFVAGAMRGRAALAGPEFVCYNARESQCNRCGLRDSTRPPGRKLDDVTPYRDLSGCNRPFGHDLADG